MEVSNETSQHKLNCKEPTVIKIYFAWRYLDYCYREYNFGNIDDLVNKCNDEFSCIYEKPRVRGQCYSWSKYSETKSVIWYNCVQNDSVKETATPKTLPTSAANKATTFAATNTKFRSSSSFSKNYSPIERMTTTTTVSSKSSPTSVKSSKLDHTVIAGSVVGVLAIVAFILLLTCFVMIRRRKNKHKATRPVSVAVGQNSNVLYVVSENIPPQPGRIDEPPAYHTLDNIPDHNHIYLKMDSRHQYTNSYINIPNTNVNNSLQNTVNISGRQGEGHQHDSVSGRNVVFQTEEQMINDFNEIRRTEGVTNHIDDLPSDTENRENNYANIDVEDDIYVIS